MELAIHGFWWIAFCLNCIEIFAATSSSDMPIIRHGRSRVRHSSEKDHIRWGLKAFDLEFNSTFYEYDNDTMELNGNQSFYGDNSSDLFYINNSGERLGSSSSSPPEYQTKQTKDSIEESDNSKATSSTLKKKLGKKQMMANIRKTVEKGVEYLKSHAHLNKENTEINSVMPTIIENNSNIKDDGGNSLISDNNNLVVSPLLDDLASTSTSISQTKENHVQNDDGEVHLRQLNITPTNDNHRNVKENPINNSAKFKNVNVDQSNIVAQFSPNRTINKQIHSMGVHEQAKSEKFQLHIQRYANNRINGNEDTIDENTQKALLVDEKSFSDSVDYGSESMPSGLYSENNEQANTEDDSEIGNFDLNENNEVSNRRYDEYFDLEALGETRNRLPFMEGSDLLTTFLRIVETQHLLGSNCTAGTALNLGEGVVDRYAHDRFRVEAEIAVNRANMLTRIFKSTSAAVQESEPLLHASVLSMVEFDDDIFAAGNCFDLDQHPIKKGLFCPFAFRLPYPNHGSSLAKDLAAEYHYLGNTSEWFFLARKNAERVIAKNEQYIKAYHLYLNSTEREVDKILSVKYEDGRWSKPYYDCGGGNIWMLTYTVPFFGHDNGTYFFKGTSGIDIDLRRVDIDQCPQRQEPGITRPLNIFAGTDKCKQRTTECVTVTGLGFRRGSYKCVCRKGFYFPDTSVPQKYFNGSTLEEEYEKLMSKTPSTYSDPNSYHCLPCAEGCDSCKDASPCVAALNWPMRTSILVLACAVIGLLPPAAYFTFRYQQVKVLRAASPALLRVIALGAFFIYCTSIVMYPNPSLYTCTARIWLREIGFSLTYGALMLKTWRISVIFRVRSAKAVKITDAALLKRLGILCGFISVALLVRTIVAPPVVVVGRTADDLKAFLCKTDWWDHTFTSMEVLFLAWGVRLCIMVRKAPSEFNESRFISMAIYNEFLLTCFLNVSMLFLQSPANPDLLYIIFFCHTQLTVTLLLALIFGSKVYLVFRSGGKPEDAMGLGAKASGAKFICRSQARTLANPSTATSSTAQLGANADLRLSEQEALDHIKQLYAELQTLYERVPPRGIAVATIASLLESCRSSHHLKPQIKTPSVNPALLRYDKSTNTTVVIDVKQNGNGLAHISKADEKRSMLPILQSVDEKQNQIKDTKDKSPFLNLPLECMCTCSGAEINEQAELREHSLNRTMCSHNSNTTVEHLCQTQNDHSEKVCNDNSQKRNDKHTNCLNPSGICEHCLRNNNKLNVTKCCSSNCDCTSDCADRNEASSCTVYICNKSKKILNLVSIKEQSDDGITSDSSKCEYDRICLSLSGSFEYTEAEAAHIQPTTPSPIISISSSVAGEEDTLNRNNQTPSLISPVDDDEKLSLARESCSSNNISITTDASGSTSAGNGAGKRGKADTKLVLDLNDRSKYTKEVSV